MFWQSVIYFFSINFVPWKANRTIITTYFASVHSQKRIANILPDVSLRNQIDQNSVFHWQTFIRTIKQTKFVQHIHRDTQLRTKRAETFHLAASAPYQFHAIQQKRLFHKCVYRPALFGELKFAQCGRHYRCAAVREYSAVKSGCWARDVHFFP